MTFHPLYVFLAALLVCGLLTATLIPLCRHFDLVDVPGGRKRHRRPTPVGGGMAIAATIIVLGLIESPSWQTAGFVGGAIILLILGLIDDHISLSAPIRLLGEVVAVGVGLFAVGGVRISSLGNLLGLGNIELGVFAFPFTIFAAVGIINAVNMIDGVDGLAASFTAIIIAVWLAVIDHASLAHSLLYITLGSIIGFLLFNLRTPWQKQARIFLGDAGSLLLGYILVWVSIRSTQGGAQIMRPIIAVWLLGLPLVDTFYLMGTRLMRGESPMKADRHHLHHLLLDAGLSPGRALYVWLLLALLFVAFGLTGEFAGISSNMMFLGFIAAFIVYCALVTLGWRAVSNHAVHRRYAER